MTEPTDLLGIANEIGARVFLIDFARYAIAASLIAALVWGLRRTSWASRKIQAREATSSDFRRELFASTRTVLVYVATSIFVVWGMRNGIYTRIEGSFGLWADLGLFAAILVTHDAYFYWAHRMMHHPRLFKRFHRFHHRTITPTAWAAYSFALPEALVMALFMPVWLFFVPSPGTVIVAFLAIMILRNCMGHAGLELHARGWASHPLLKWISTTTHHDLHHAGSFTHNYGFYFTFWDKVMGTEHPRYVEIYDRVTARAEPVTSPDASLASNAA